jgi:hypothetical protein
MKLAPIKQSSTTTLSQDKLQGCAQANLMPITMSRASAGGSATEASWQLEGYPRLADMMERSTETAIFRRFGALNALNLLRLQAELHDLEHELEEVIKEDFRSKDSIRAGYSTDFKLVARWAQDGDSIYHETLVKIGEKLEQYSQCSTVKDSTVLVADVTTR